MSGLVGFFEKGNFKRTPTANEYLTALLIHELGHHLDSARILPDSGELTQCNGLKAIIKAIRSAEIGPTTAPLPTGCTAYLYNPEEALAAPQAPPPESAGSPQLNRPSVSECVSAYDNLMPQQADDVHQLLVASFILKEAEFAYFWLIRPNLPPGLTSRVSGLLAWAKYVSPGGPGDAKRIGDLQREFWNEDLENLGNFAYGASGTIIGFSETSLLNAGGLLSWLNGTTGPGSWMSAEGFDLLGALTDLLQNGAPLSPLLANGNSGDEARDAFWIRQGIGMGNAIKKCLSGH